MRYVRESLGSLEAAQDYNSVRRHHRGGCIDSLACLKCYHVIGDSICLCAGIGVCPNCGYEEPKPKFTTVPIKEFNWSELFYNNKTTISEDYSI